MIKIDISEILEKAAGLGNKAKFEVRCYDSEPREKLYSEKEMTYIQLGMYLMTHTKEIKRIDIRHG